MDTETTALFDCLLIRLFQPVQYGTKPEGRLAAITSAAGQRPPTSSPTTSTPVSTTSQSAQVRGKSPVTIATTTAASHGKTMGCWHRIVFSSPHSGYRSPGGVIPNQYFLFNELILLSSMRCDHIKMSSCTIVMQFALTYNFIHAMMSFVFPFDFKNVQCGYAQRNKC